MIRNIKENIVTVGLHQSEISCCSKDSTKEMKRQSGDCKKIFTLYKLKKDLHKNI